MKIEMNINGKAEMFENDNYIVLYPTWNVKWWKARCCHVKKKKCQWRNVAKKLKMWRKWWRRPSEEEEMAKPMYVEALLANVIENEMWTKWNVDIEEAQRRRRKWSPSAKLAPSKKINVKNERNVKVWAWAAVILCPYLLLFIILCSIINIQWKYVKKPCSSNNIVKMKMWKYWNENIKIILIILMSN